MSRARWRSRREWLQTMGKSWLCVFISVFVGGCPRAGVLRLVCSLEVVLELALALPTAAPTGRSLEQGSELISRFSFSASVKHNRSLAGELASNRPRFNRPPFTGVGGASEPGTVELEA